MLPLGAAAAHLPDHLTGGGISRRWPEQILTFPALWGAGLERGQAISRDRCQASADSVCCRPAGGGWGVVVESHTGSPTARAPKLTHPTGSRRPSRPETGRQRAGEKGVGPGCGSSVHFQLACSFGLQPPPRAGEAPNVAISSIAGWPTRRGRRPTARVASPGSIHTVSLASGRNSPCASGRTTAYRPRERGYVRQRRNTEGAVGNGGSLGRGALCLEREGEKWRRGVFDVRWYGKYSS